MNHLNAFSQELNRAAPRPERLALIIGSVGDPALDVEAYLDQLDDLTHRVEERMPDLHGRAAVHALFSILYGEMGFRGNVANYYDPANSFLHQLLDQKLGLPITLCLLYRAIAQRLGLPLEGMGFPAHFMLRYEDEAESWLLDPFYGELIPAATVADYLSRVVRQRVELRTPLDHYRVTTHMWILRLLNNLRAVYLANDALEEATQILSFMVLVAPNEEALWRERALLRFQSGQLLGAESDLRHLFYQRRQIRHFVEHRPIGILQPFVPIEEDAAPFTLTGEMVELLTVLDQIRTSVSRLN